MHVGGPFTATRVEVPPKNLALEDETHHALFLIFEQMFPAMRTDAVTAVRGIEKAAGDDLARRVLAAVNPGQIEDAITQVQAVLRKYAQERAEVAARMAAEAGRVDAGALDQMLVQANERAITWADAHAAELVTEITDVTREQIRDVVTQGVASGASNDEIASTLEDAYAFSRERSMLIARTETSFAENRGTLEGWQATDLVTGKESLPDVDPCPICQANAAQGVIPIDTDFQSGQPGPPYHPNCECTLLASIPEE